MYTQIVPQLWMMIPRNERDLIAKEFNLPRTGVTEVINQDVVTDGYRAEDLKNITLEKMCAYIGSQESFMRAWELTVMKANAELNPPAVFIGTQEELNKIENVIVEPKVEKKEKIKKEKQNV